MKNFKMQRLALQLHSPSGYDTAMSSYITTMDYRRDCTRLVFSSISANTLGPAIKLAGETLRPSRLDTIRIKHRVLHALHLAPPSKSKVGYAKQWVYFFQYLACASTCFWGSRTCCVCARTVLKCKMLLLDSPGQCGHTLSLYRQTTGTTVISTDN